MRKNYLKIRGGSDQLTNAFANSSELSNKIYLNHAVTSITQNSDNVIVNAGGNQFQADRVLCTVPLTVLNKINFSIDKKISEKLFINSITKFYITKTPLHQD